MKLTKRGKHGGFFLARPATHFSMGGSSAKNLRRDKIPLPFTTPANHGPGSPDYQI